MKIACITGSRADWNGLGMVAKALREAGHDVFAIPTGHHDYLGTIDLIDADGIPMLVRASLSAHGDTPSAIARAAADATESVSHALAMSLPDMVVIVGDRFEIFAAASAAAIMRIPIAHLSGGDVTEGSVDDKLRNAITMLADLHFPTNQKSYERLVRMLSTRSAFVNDATNIHMVGAPALDRIRLTPIAPRETVFDGSPGKINILVAYHPATREQNPSLGLAQMLHALADVDAWNDDIGFLVLGTNADIGSGNVERMLTSFAENCVNGRFVQNLPPALFYSALTHCDVMVGNSSAGLYEAPSFGIPVVNVGTRQKGRIEARNVLTCTATRDAVTRAVNTQLAEGRKPCDSPYGDGHAAEKIVSVINGFERTLKVSNVKQYGDQHG